METSLVCEGMVLELCGKGGLIGGLIGVLMGGMVLLLEDDDVEGRLDGSIGKRDNGISLIV
jgi:hypothetical protein